MSSAHRIFLDSGVILKGTLSQAGACGTILEIACLKLPVLSFVTGRGSILEIHRSLSRKASGALQVYDDVLKITGIKVIPLPTRNELKRLQDQSPSPHSLLAASVLSSSAEALVTADAKLVKKLPSGFSCPVLSPEEFLNGLLPHILRRTAYAA